MTVNRTTEGPVAVLTLDYPNHHNALSAALVGDLLEAVREVDRDPVRAIVIAGKGRFFSAGANIPDLLDRGWLAGQAADDDPVALFQTLATHRLPVLAAVNGPALGGGFELCLSCDLVVAADTAWFALPEIGLGVFPNTALARLPALVGRRRALEIMATRRRIPADEAAVLGLVNALAPAADVVAATVRLARSIVDGAPPGALKALKAVLNQHAPTDWAHVRTSVSQLAEPEWREGLAAFVEKRSADYQPFWDQTVGAR
jgi:enoyl-CoA hydratase